MTETRERKDPVDRREEILEAAMDVADANNLYHMTGQQVATQARCARTLINQYFYSFSNLQRLVIRRAVREKRWAIVHQAYARDDNRLSLTENDLKELTEWVVKNARV